ncbi:MAG: hypothetical protein H6822_01395 [Planctomycetaceae bacterium]|nr:hypothetical protein [Planctomycetaceae bacterium]
MSKPTGGEISGSIDLEFDGGSDDEWHIDNESNSKYQDSYDAGYGWTQLHKSESRSTYKLDDVYGSSYDGHLFKWNHSPSTRAIGWCSGDRFLYLPNQGSARANWTQNSSRLRAEMRSRMPIFDSYIDGSGNLIRTHGFLNMERILFINRGWTFNPSTGAWHPPVGN